MLKDILITVAIFFGAIISITTIYCIFTRISPNNDNNQPPTKPKKGKK